MRNMKYIFEITAKMLTQFAQAASFKKIEVVRVARVIYSLLLLNGNLLDKTLQRLCIEYIKKEANQKGGWSDPEETAWVLSVLEQLSENESEPIRKGKKWLDNVRHPGGGWGRHPRDQARIITTGIVITLVPSVTTDVDREWVRQEWERDIVSPVRLSYKGGFYLLTVDNKYSENIDRLVQETITFLAEDQNDDGGFGPWRNHPIGSDPWSTGVVLWGLSKWVDRVDPQVIDKALAWLERTQLPSGYWPYHYLDEGTSYALIGAVSAMHAVESRK